MRPAVHLLTPTSPHFEAAKTLLQQFDLPVDDLGAPNVTLWAALDQGVLRGLVGFERAGSTGLLRSLAVSKGGQGQGLAAALCAHVFEQARQNAITEIYLLTTSAADYFPRLGFTSVARQDVPKDVQRTAQFSSLCPGSAAVMRKLL